MTNSQDTSAREVKLPRELDLLAAESLKETLLAELDEGEGLLLDASDVERVSTPCIEVLVSAQKTCVATSQSFQISNSSQVLVDAFSALGLDEQFKGWRTIQ
ncbi:MULTISPECIES: STAS domain-containing protein [Kordiimonas]|uniref:STAS domain-containing protein n=1 Tax=Kordiimonas TaxID=288021 RepID=UPI001FF5D376|nr:MULTISPECIES: STAS domain-containing protein [Kordiimonas]MCK0069689.1 STAS domain-containing protein [Kordiimonas laminariae]UTW57154.1 STAS domain-containing protein [Kordiimonas sp. SCSIO 12603]